MREELGTRGALIGMTVLAGLFGGLAMAIYPGWPVVAHWLAARLKGQLSWLDFLNFITALGTCGAVVVALWLAQRQSRKVEADALARANLHAARIADRLKRTYAAIRRSPCSSPFRNETVDRSQQNFMAFLEYKSFSNQTFFQPDTETLIALVALPNHCAHRIGRAFDLLAAVQQDIQVVLTARRAESFSLEEGDNILSRWLGTVISCEQLLQVAVEECERACDVGAPLPSGQELFGDP